MSPMPEVAASVLQTPLTNLMQMSMGVFGEWQANAVVNLFNGKRVIRSLLAIGWWGLTKGRKFAKLKM